MEMFKNPRVKQGVTIALAALSVILLIVVIARHTVLAEPSVEKLSRERAAIDAETLKTYPKFYVEDGSTWPWKNPDTGKSTLYPAEFCYWTKDGKAKLDPTYVLLNELVGKAGKTICPDCGRVVVPHNPMPPNTLLVEAAKAAGKIKDDSK